MKLKFITSSLLLIVLVSMLIIPLFSGNAQAAPGDIHVFPLDDYEKDVEMKETVTYRWGLYNNNTVPNMLFLNDPAEEYGWEAEFTDSYLMLEPGEFYTIELIVQAPSSRDYPTHVITIDSTVTDVVTEDDWELSIGTTTTTVSGGAYIPPTKAFDYIPNYLGAVDALDNEYGVFILTIGVWVLIGAIIFFVLDPVVKHFTKMTKTEIDDMILSIIKGPVFYLIVSFGFIHSLRVLNIPWSILDIFETLFTLLVIILLSWMAYKVFQDVLLIWGKSYAEESETTIDDVALPLLEKAGMIVIFMIATIAILNVFGVDPTMLVAGMGIMGLVIAFAAQDTLGNFISGMFLLTDRPFKVGDLVLMGNGDYCRVEKIGMRSTKLYNTFDHDVIILPNSKIANEKVINLTEPDNKMKVKVTIGVDYDTDIQKAKKIMLDVANKHTDVINAEDRDPFVRLVDFGDSSINLKLYTWVYHLDDQWRVGGEMREEIFELFKKEGIDIPFPQRVVHMQGYGDNMPSKSG